jgi:DNA-binding response OmpR family regulator
VRDIDKGLEAGFFRYLTKPIRVGEFMTALDEGLALAAGQTQVDFQPEEVALRPGASTA